MTKPVVKVYIDGANMFYAQRKMGWLVDWKKIRIYLNKIYQIQEIRFYHSYRREKQEEENYFKFLRKNNFHLFTKPLKKIIDESGKVIFKANFDVEITRDILFDLLIEKDFKDGLVFFSGDSDFATLFWDLKKKFNKKIFVYSSHTFLSWELRLASTEHYFLEDLKKVVFLRDFDLTEKGKGVINKALSRRSS
jgi:uncharacterized LabA/DUF88 family protein